MSLNGGGAIGMGIELSVSDLASGVLDKARTSVVALEASVNKLGLALVGIDLNISR